MADELCECNEHRETAGFEVGVKRSKGGAHEVGGSLTTCVRVRNGLRLLAGKRTWQTNYASVTSTEKPQVSR